MYVNRALMLLLGIAVIFLPAVEHWLWDSDSPWYRPYLLWFGFVIAGWWNQRSRYPDEL
jgi:hypothetical protein